MIKQELQAIAEGVAASVLQTTISNPEISLHEKNESPSLSDKDMEIQKSDLEIQLKAKVEVLKLPFLTLFFFSFVCMDSSSFPF